MKRANSVKRFVNKTKKTQSYKLKGCLRRERSQCDQDWEQVMRHPLAGVDLTSDALYLFSSSLTI